MDPTGRFVYVANLGNILLGPGTVSAYSIDATGALTPIGAPVAAGTGPIAVAVDATGRFVYVANNGPVLGAGDVSAYSVGVTGTLTQIGTPAPVDSPPSSPTSIAVDPAGRFFYVPNLGSNNISAYSIDGTGALTALGLPVPAGLAPIKLAVTGSSERIQGRIDLICRPLDAEPGLFGSAVPFLGRHCYFETSSLNSVHTYGAYPISAHLAPRKDYISDFANGQPRIPGGCGTAVLATECVNIPVLQSQSFEGIVDGLEQAVSAG